MRLCRHLYRVSKSLLSTFCLFFSSFFQLLHLKYVNRTTNISLYSDTFMGFFFIVGKPKFSLPLGFLCCVLDCMDNECGIRSKSNRLSAKCCLFGVLICHLTSLHIFAVFMLLLLLLRNCLFVNLLTLTISCRLVVAVIHSSCRCIPTNYMLFYLVLVLTFQNQTKSFSPLALFWFPHLFIQKLKHWGYTQKLNSFVGSSAKRTTMQSYKIFICKM